MIDPAYLASSNLLQIFNQRDTAERQQQIRNIWCSDGILWSSEGTAIGHKAVNRAVAANFLRFPEFEYHLRECVQENGYIARVSWTLGTPGLPSAFSGSDIVIAHEGQIIAMYRFLEGAAF